MVLGFIGDVLGFGGDDVSQETTVDIVNQNDFSPNVITNVALNGLDALGAFIRDGFETLAGVSQGSIASADQSGLNISSAIDGAGVNISNSINGVGGSIEAASDTLGGSLNKAGANIAFAVVAGATIYTAGRLLKNA